ncbi:MAG: carboxypeptidase M32 [Candidatus Hodarchaeales archaeon]|jgi:carboxypeptidase Taq
MAPTESYKSLMKSMQRYYLLEQVLLVQRWDSRVMMPPKGINQRSKQLALLSSLQHAEVTNPKIGKLLESLGQEKTSDSLSFHEQRNIYLTKRLYERETQIPEELVEKYTEQAAKTNATWQQAKRQSNYDLFKDSFEKLLALVKERASAIDDKDPLDVLMDAYFEPGMTSAKLEPLFEELKNGLIPLIKKCISSSQQPDPSILKRPCAIEIQKKLSEDAARLIGYDFEAGRIDETEHPFSSGYLKDVRITTHYYDDFGFSFFAVLHEAGHAMYSQAINKDYAYEPIGTGASYGVHESQSRFMENIIGRSLEFWKFYLLRFKTLTREIFQDIDLVSFYHACNYVQLSPIRIFADELTYALHIILRFEMERDLLNDKIDLDDLPGAWNDKVKEYLAIDVVDDAQGVLQDVHWSQGYFGYFPSYELGNLYGAQLLAAMAKDFPDYKDQIAGGNFMGIKGWLDDNVRSHGGLYEPEALIERATGEKPSARYLLTYLTEKYSDIYGL